jgi:hypothetical protein
MWRRMCLEVEQLIRTAGFEPVKVGGIEQSGRLEVGGDPSRSRSRPRRGAVIDRWGLIASPPWPGAPPRSGLRPDGLDGADHRGVEGHGQWYRGRGGSRVHTLSPAPLNHCPIHDMLTVLHVSDLLTLI